MRLSLDNFGRSEPVIRSGLDRFRLGDLTTADQLGLPDVADQSEPRAVFKQAPFGGRLLYRLGSILFYGPLKNMLGFSNIRVAYTAGEAIGADLLGRLGGLARP